MVDEQLLVELDVTDLAFDGKAVAHNEGKVVFLNGGLPGERVRAEITRRKARYDQARVIEILRRAPSRVDAPCRHFSRCGGCTWQDLLYPEQLLFKRKQVVDCLERLAKRSDIEVLPAVGSVEVFGYRNKMEFSFNVTADGGFTLGLHERGSFRDIFDLTTCYIAQPVASRLVNWMREYVARTELPVYDVKYHTGYLRFFMIRQARRTADLMVNLVTNYGPIPRRDEFIRELTEAFPEVTTIVHNQNGQKSNIATGEIEQVLFGKGYIEEILFESRFHIRANSFFQTNSLQTETLYRTALEMLQPEPQQRALDLYCGTGSIGILLARYVNEVVGVELVADAVAAARENAAINEVKNISFFEGFVRDFLGQQNREKQYFDVAVIDPPRAGLHPKAVKELLAMAPEKILYISCNPATFARDIADLTHAGYRLPLVQPIDMFPHTMHIELVAVLYKS